MKLTYNNTITIMLLLSATNYCIMHAAEQAPAPLQKWKPFLAQDKAIAEEKRKLLSVDQKTALNRKLAQTIAEKPETFKLTDKHREKVVLAVQALLKEGANPNYRVVQDEKMSPLLIWTLKNQRRDTDPRIIKDLVLAGANVDARDENGSTALIHATNYLLEPITKILVRTGADAQIMNRWNYVALDYAQAEKFFVNRVGRQVLMPNTQKTQAAIIALLKKRLAEQDGWYWVEPINSIFDQ